MMSPPPSGITFAAHPTHEGVAAGSQQDDSHPLAAGATLFPDAMKRFGTRYRPWRLRGGLVAGAPKAGLEQAAGP